MEMAIIRCVAHSSAASVSLQWISARRRRRAERRALSGGRPRNMLRRPPFRMETLHRREIE